MIYKGKVIIFRKTQHSNFYNNVTPSGFKKDNQRFAIIMSSLWDWRKCRRHI